MDVLAEWNLIAQQGKLCVRVKSHYILCTYQAANYTSKVEDDLQSDLLVPVWLGVESVRLTQNHDM